MTGEWLFHFSEDGDISRFVPRPVAVPTVRPPGMDWLNGPLVWAIDARHQPLYLFPRDCPRILVWPTASTSATDHARYWTGGDAQMIAYVETGWVDHLRDAVILRYTLPGTTFTSLDDAGMWVSREAVVPERVEALGDLPRHLASLDVDLRPVPDLRPLRTLWGTSLHVSGLRLRNCTGGWP